MKKYVSYIRVINRPKDWRYNRDEASQRDTAEQHALKTGGRIIKEFIVPAHRRGEREQIAEALQTCRKNKATLLIPYLEKLERAGELFGALLRAGVVFQVAEVASSRTRGLIKILNTAAETNRKRHSEAIKAGIGKSKAGKPAPTTAQPVPGVHRLAPEDIIKGRKMSAELRKRKAQ